ncbi:S8 family serine peptidase [Alishewanella sp. d11]|uniref:S8 family serine peptidase n=1 Tax=Alishewanella sp. d11 TaxID=3414030 RepID=UPI003BF894B7
MNHKQKLLTLLIGAAVTSQAFANNDMAAVYTPESNFNFSAMSQEEKRYIVRFADTISPSSTQNWTQQINKIFTNNNIELLFHLATINASVANLTPQQIQKLLAQGNVLSIEEDSKRYLIESMRSTSQNGLAPLSESVPYGINMVQAPLVSDSMAGNAKVCVIDTGYQLGHPDLPSSNATGFSFQGHGTWSTDGNGHGTHVAGTMVALRNNTGVVGVIGSGQSGIHNVKIFNDSGNWTFSSNLIQAIQSCKDAGSKVVNMSLGGSQGNASEQNAMQQFLDGGMLLIAAAGNSGNTSLSYPASYNAVVSVAALDSNRNLASFSQRNAQVELAAPGVRVNSTYPGNRYVALDGTSMASPHVAGVAALVWSNHSSCSASQIRNALNATALDLGAAGRDNSFGFGLVQAKAAHDWLTNNGCDGAGNGGDNGGAPNNELENGQPKSGLAAGRNEELSFFIDIPQGARNLAIRMSGGTGDADLYVRSGSEPSLSQFDCRPYRTGNAETCSFTTPTAGRYFVKLVGYSAFSGVELVATYDEPASGGTGFDSTIPNLSVTAGQWRHYSVDVPAGMARFTAQISGGTGDADLYVRRGSQSTTTTFDCRPYRNGNNETCTFNNPEAGTWFVSVRGYLNSSGVTLRVTANP